ncbi:MAG: hypothetical protein KAT75_02875, partial [Dehalococcoidia bacterium]|nr:hypothetical protein [Dehalococcoidia bacterium]
VKAKIVYVAMALVIAIPIAAAGVAFAQGPTTVYISPASQTVSPGEVFTVDIFVEPAEPISGVQAALSFDPSLVTANSVVEGDLLNQGGALTAWGMGLPPFPIIDNDAGTITNVANYILAPPPTVSGPGTFITISFTAKEATGTSQLDLSNVIVTNPEAEVLPIDVTGGSVTIEEEGEGCFIATAAYGTSTAAEIDVLRAFRDEVLLESTLGSQLVEWYYQTSPPVADFISEHDVLRTLVRELLVDPVVWVVDAVWAVDAIWVVDVNWAVDAIETLLRD